MVVSHDDIDPGAAQAGDWSDRAGSAIARHHDLRSRFQRGVDPGIAEIIAVLDSPRDEGHRLAAEPPDHAGENGRRADSIDVVVAVDKDQLLLADGASESRHRLVHRQEFERIVETIELRAKEELGL